MKTISHTPGPWTLAAGRVIETTGGEFAVSRTTGDGWRGSPRELDANARLVAAAPELLEALREAEKTIRWAAQEAAGRVRAEIVGGWLRHAEQAGAAIAKAEGRD